MDLNERLYQAIKKDDLKEFKSCMETSNCGPLRLGRFPVLSVMYLYNSRRILHAYEKTFIKLNSWRDIGEPLELSGKFRSVAGKCLRIYLNEVVTPIEMLLLLDRNYKVKKVFQQCHVMPPVKQRLADIYFIRWGLKAEFVSDKIVLERRPLTHAEIRQWLLRSACAVLCLAIIVSTPFVVNAFYPFITDAVGALNVVSWSQIRFNSNKTFALKNDVTVPNDFFVEEMNCTLLGNGHTVKVDGNGLFGKLNGALKDIVFETNGTPVVQSVSVVTETVKENGKQKIRLKTMAEEVTVNALVNMQTDTAVGFFAIDNYGVIQNVTVNVSGSLTARAPQQSSDDATQPTSVYCGGVVATNHWSSDKNGHYYAQLLNCTANYDNLTLHGVAKADFGFGGIVGSNEANVSDCTTTGAITADTFDVAGICATNNYVIAYSENKASLTQTTDVSEWNPIAAGIVLTNYYVVDNCTNNGNVTAVSRAVAPEEGSPGARAIGIAYQNISHGDMSFVQYCTNNGNVTATAVGIDASAAGICYVSNSMVHTGVNNGKISAVGTKQVVAAGIINDNNAYVYRAVNSGEIVAESNDEAIVGGIAGTSSWQTMLCQSHGSITVAAKVCYVGGIVGYADNYQQEFGFVSGAIASCEINVTMTSATGSLAAVGGILGYLAERPADYRGGYVTDCYFTGSLATSAGAYVGGVVGVVHEGVYNEFVVGVKKDDKGNETKLFVNNLYSDDCGASKAFGAAYTQNNSYKAVADIGTQVATKAAIEGSAAYREILSLFEEE